MAVDHSGYPAYIDKLPPIEAAFERWWWDEGSAPPAPEEELETFVHRMTRIAWCNGAYIAVADNVPLDQLS